MESQDIKKAGLKVTLPRLKVLEIMEQSASRHMSAEEVYKELLIRNEDVGLATVYRVLTQFESAQLVIRHHFNEGHSVFELNEGGHHDHIVCVDCGHVEEFFDDTIERRQEEIASGLGFTLSEHSLYMYGSCQKKDCKYR